MQIIHIQSFTQLISTLLSNKICKQVLAQSAIVYNIKPFNILNLSLTEAKYIHSRTQSAQKTVNTTEFISGEIFDDQNDQIWHINELKLFVWVTVCYSYLTKKHVSEFQQKNWNFLVSVFPTKTLQMLQYQAYRLIKDDKHKRKWTNQQSDLLFSIIEQNKIQGKWNQISKLFYFQSNRKLFCTPQKCRQYWFNHLNPRIRHGEWTLEQDLKLFQQVDKNGCKWSLISKLMKGSRTQHMVKNRFKSIVNRWRNRLFQFPVQRIIKKVIQNLNSQMIKKQLHIKEEQIKQLLIEVKIYEEQQNKVQTSNYWSQLFTINSCMSKHINQLKQLQYTGINEQKAEVKMEQIDEEKFIKQELKSNTLLQSLDEAQDESFLHFLLSGNGKINTCP